MTTEASTSPKNIPSRSIASSSLWNLAGMCAPMVVALVCIPPLVSRLGTARFGLLTLVWMLVGYFSLFDFGFGRALTQVIAARLGSGDHEDIVDISRNSLALMGAFGIFTSLLMVLGAPFIVSRVLKIPPALQHEALVSLIILALATPITVTTVGLQGLLAAYQRFDYLNLVRIPLGAFSFAGAAAVLPFSHSLIPITIALVFGRFVALIATWFLTRRVVEGLMLFGTLRPGAVRPLLGFAGWMTVTNIVSPIMNQLDRFVVGALISVEAMSFYALPYEITSRILVIPSALATTLFPAFSSSFSTDQKRARDLLERSTSIALSALFPILLGFVVFAEPGLRLWVGAQFAAKSTSPLQWLAVGVLLNGAAMMVFAFIQGAGRADVTAKLHLLELPFYAVILWFLLKSRGIEGAAIAWAIRASVDCFMLTIFASQSLPGGASLRARLVGKMAFGAALLWLARFHNFRWFAVALGLGWTAWEAKRFLESRRTNSLSTAASADIGESALDATYVAPIRKNTAAVIVTFYPDGGFADRLRRIAENVNRVIIVDNGSDASARSRLDLSQSADVEILYLGKNVGVAEALNIGCNRAIELGFDWVLLFDHDSVVDEDFLPRLSSTLNAHPQHEHVRVIGANFVVEGTNTVAFSSREGSQPWIEVRTVITSGTLMPLRNLSEIGHFRSDFFIDLVDHEYCLRARKKGFQVITTADPIMHHGLNSPSEVTLAGKRLLVLTNSAAFRRYFIARNSVLMARQYWRSDFTYICRTLFGTLISALFVKVPLEREQRGEKAIAIVRGLRDGVLDRTGAGRYSPETVETESV